MNSRGTVMYKTITTARQPSLGSYAAMCHSLPKIRVCAVQSSSVIVFVESDKESIINKQRRSKAMYGLGGLLRQINMSDYDERSQIAFLYTSPRKAPHCDVDRSGTTIAFTCCGLSAERSQRARKCYSAERTLHDPFPWFCDRSVLQ
jgi:replicative DNA helicase